MQTLGNKTKRYEVKGESWDLTHTFTAGEDLHDGQIVKFASGKVVKFDGTGVPFGVVAVGAKTDKDATIRTNAVAIYIAKASEALVAGDLLKVTGNDADGYVQYGKAGSGDYVVAVAYTDASASGDEITVGIGRAFVKQA